MGWCKNAIATAALGVVVLCMVWCESALGGGPALPLTITIDDPKAYTKPWTVKLNQTIKLDSDLIDFICNENERDTRHLLVK